MLELLLLVHGSPSCGAVPPAVELIPEVPDEPGDVEMDEGDDSGEHLEVCKEGAVYSQELHPVECPSVTQEYLQLSLQELCEQLCKELKEGM